MKTKKIAPKKAALVKKSLVKKGAPAKKAASAKKVAAKKASAKKASTKKVAPKKKVATKISGVATSNAVAAQSRHIIAKSLGIAMVEQFVLAKSDLKGITFNEGVEFDRDLFEQVLNLPGCVKVRCYNAINTTNGEHTLVITGVDAKKNDIYFNFAGVVTNIQGKDADQAADADGVGDMGDACPRYEPQVVTLV
jgi:hypothetical protein